jgi:hypothetical protein
MKHIRGMLIGTAGVAVMGAGGLLAQEESPYRISFNVAFVNQYLWRGFVANDTPSVQPELRLGYKGFSVSSWSSFSHTAPYNQNWTEHTLNLAYTRRLGNLTASLGWQNEVNPNLESDLGRYTNEVYFGLAHDSILRPSVTVYRDVHRGNGGYYYLSLGHSFRAGRGVSINPLVGVGVNEHLYIDQTTVSNFDIGVSVKIPLGHAVLSPFFQQMIGHRSLFGRHNVFGVMLSIIQTARPR